MSDIYFLRRVLRVYRARVDAEKNRREFAKTLVDIVATKPQLVAGKIILKRSNQGG